MSRNERFDSLSIGSIPSKRGKAIGNALSPTCSLEDRFDLPKIECPCPLGCFGGG